MLKHGCVRRLMGWIIQDECGVGRLGMGTEQCAVVLVISKPWRSVTPLPVLSTQLAVGAPAKLGQD